MNKKILALCLVLALSLTAVSALATGSKSVNDITGTQGDAPVTVVTINTECQAVLDGIAAVTGKGDSAVTFFDADTQKAITSAIPATVKAEALKLDEFFQLALKDQTTATGGYVTLSTAASYKASDAIVTLFGIVKDGQVTWTVLPCSIVDGKLTVQLTASNMADMKKGSAVIAILSNKD